MKIDLEDIRKRLRRNEYRNEEHVRLCIVARLLQSLGWDIWDPTQVDAECIAAPLEDSTKVDFALSSRPRTPDVFIEVKRVGQAQGQLERVEKQLRDYNRDQTARFTVITDGRMWWLYHSLSAGEFRDKRYAMIDLLDPGQSLDTLEALFHNYLGKSNIDSGVAEDRAKKELSLIKKQRAFLECRPEAHRLAIEPPYPPVPDILVQLMARQGHKISSDEARQLLESTPPQGQANSAIRATAPSMPSVSAPPRLHLSSDDVRSFEPDPPPDLTHTVVDNATFGPERCTNWNALVMTAVRFAYRQSLPFERVRQVSKANIKQGNHEGFRTIADTTWSYRDNNTPGAWRSAYALAHELRQPIEVHFRWYEKEGAAFPNQKGVIRWHP